MTASAIWIKNKRRDAEKKEWWPKCSVGADSTLYFYGSSLSLIFLTRGPAAFDAT